MGSINYVPTGSGRMGILWTIGTIGETAVLEFGSMGHMIYASKWFERSNLRLKSQLVATHINERDISLGITKRINDAVKEVLDSGVKVVFLLPSSVPETIGIDMESIAMELSAQYPEVTFIPFDKGGMRETLFEGIEEALYKICKHVSFDPPKAHESIMVNIIGSHIDFENFHSDMREIKRLLKKAFNININCILTAETSWSKIKSMSNAQLSIAIRKEGVKACKYLSKKHGTPYVAGRPYGYEGTIRWLEAIAKALDVDIDRSFIEKELDEGQHTLNTLKMMLSYGLGSSRIALYGHSDIVEGLKGFLEEDLEVNAIDSWIYEEAKEQEVMRILHENEYSLVMANQGVLDSLGLEKGIAIERNVSSTNYNIYRSPYMGFRGALNICDLLIRLSS